MLLIGVLKSKKQANSVKSRFSPCFYVFSLWESLPQKFQSQEIIRK